MHALRLKEIHAAIANWRYRSRKQAGWHQVAESVGAAALLYALGHSPLIIAYGFSLNLAPAALIMLSLGLRAVVVLLAIAITVTMQIVMHDPWMATFAYGLSALLCAQLVRRRIDAAIAVTIYAACNLIVPLLITENAAVSWPRQAGWETLQSTVNAVSALAMFQLLPRYIRNRRYRWRGSIGQFVFVITVAASLWPILITLRVLPLRQNVTNLSDLFEIGVPCYAVLTVAAAGLFARWLQAALGQLNSELFEIGIAATQRRRRPRRLPMELVRLAMPWQRRIRHFDMLLRRAHRELSDTKEQNKRIDTALRGAMERLRSQSQQLTEAQTRDNRSLQQLQQLLSNANAKIKKVQANRNVFIAMMSHEVRTPLHGLMATLSLLREESLTAEGTKRLDIARASARTLLKIANDILDLSRIDAGGFSFDKKPFGPRQLLSDVVEEFQAMAQAQGLDLKAETADAVPPALLGDRDRIHQIVGNLISNGLKFSTYGGVKVRADWRDGELICDVIDTGMGVPDNKREAIFDSFVQIEVNTGRFPGTGLGLTISRYLAQAMGGSLHLLSTGKQGSTFRLQLLLEVSDEPAEEDQSARVLAHPTGHVLVVEDNDANQYVAKVLLESLGCKVDVVGSGAAALEAVQHHRLDLILMDCRMPGMDGYETTRRLRAKMSTHVPIVAMTANALQEDKVQCLEAGMDDFLAKPFNKGLLSRLLSKWLAGGSQSPAAPTLALDAAEAILDTEVLKELWESLQWRIEPLREIYDAFVGNVHKLQAQMSRPSEVVGTEHTLRLLHTVSGSAGMVGAKRIGLIAAAAEQLSREHKLSAASPEILALPAALREFENELERRLAMLTELRFARY